MSWFSVFAFAATAALQIAFSSLLVWLVASNWLFDRKLILVSAGIATALVATTLPFNDDRVSSPLGIILCLLVGAVLLSAWLRKSRLAVGER